MNTSLPQETTKKKVRGIKKKCSAMVQALTNATNEFPLDCISEEYWHYHLPVAQSFIDSKHTPRSVRRLCIQTMINRANFLAQHKSTIAANCHVLSLISLPDLWASEITIFFTENYFQNFFDRNTQWQKWSLLSDRNLTKEYNLTVPKNFQIKGYKNESFDADNPNCLVYTGEIWAIGELNNLL